MTDAATGKVRKSTATIWLFGFLVLAIIGGANAHLVYVAISSQPDCVAHLKDKGVAQGEYRAANSSC